MTHARVSNISVLFYARTHCFVPTLGAAHASEKKMTGHFYAVLVSVCALVNAAPPAQQRIYQQHASEQIQQANPLDYYLQNPEVDNYYRSAQQKQVAVSGPSGEAARLESLEPDSEVELVPGVQQPQQPPQQNPVAPNIPGLLPGQRVFIVHMPVPGYSPGTIGGYQPVYIVAAGAQGNAAYPGNGFQNAVLLDPSGQAFSPVGGYGSRAGVPPQFLGAPFALQRPFDFYQDHGVGQPGGPALQSNSGRDLIRFANIIGLQRPINANAYQGPVAAIQNAALNKQGQTAAPVPLKQASEELKESADHKKNFRPSAALQRNKA